MPSLTDITDASLADLPEFLTVDEAAILLRVGRTTAYALVARWFDTVGVEGLPAIRLGTRIRVPKAAIVDLVRQTVRADE